MFSKMYCPLHFSGNNLHTTVKHGRQQIMHSTKKYFKFLQLKFKNELNFSKNLAEFKLSLAEFERTYI